MMRTNHKIRPIEPRNEEKRELLLIFKNAFLKTGRKRHGIVWHFTSSLSIKSLVDEKSTKRELNKKYIVYIQKKSKAMRMYRIPWVPIKK